MQRTFERDGYKLIWSDGGISDGIGGYAILNPEGEMVLHATRYGPEPMEEEEAMECLDDVPGFLKRLEEATKEYLAKEEAEKNEILHPES